LRELGSPIVRLAGTTEWADDFQRMTDRLVDAAGQVLAKASV
jgi:hypothetical protein